MTRHIRRWLALCCALVMGSAMTAAAAGAQSGDPDAGEAVYDASCAACHQPGGTGVPGAFPPLAGNPSIADAAYVSRVISEGLSGEITVLGETYNAVMPAVPLDASQIADVIAYLQTLGGAVTTTTQPGGDGTVAPPPGGGDAVRGELLFTGQDNLQNGGPACLACHSAADHGHLNGPGLGPDLTNAFARLGGTAGLSVWLTTPPSATMTPLFDDRPLTEAEIGDLVAFLERTSLQGRTGGVDFMWVFGLAGALALFGLMALVLKRPRPTYQERLRSES